uniref:S1-like domain-containing protein n=1 Tax=Meloidogyne javanica TaxID=6303 RepID=A0A915NBA8_MELJA
MPKYLRRKCEKKRGDKNKFGERKLIEKDGDNQVYGQVQKLLGNCRLMAFCFDGKDRLCRIRGSLRKITWINVGDIVLIGLREYQDNMGDVILKYTQDEVRALRESGQISESVKVNDKDIEILFENKDKNEEIAVMPQMRKFSISESEEEETDEIENDKEEKANYVEEE